ncbi:MAG: SDR family NAD(P)-dependent oxidoreductase [Rhizobacter sp.]|nr:SDR family NAD(P)-dependent oxidoreductase [Rhizobacter sp.]
MASAGSGNTQTALVTGASSGIGEALARRLARDGVNLVLVARRADKLEALAAALADEFGVKAVALAADLADPAAAEKLAAALRRRRLAIDILVNCAGVLEQGGFVGMARQRVQPMIDLNVGGLTAMLSAFVPAMVGRGQGRILNVASIAAFQPVPSLAVYAATKAYVLSLTESLAEELRGTGVTATALCPGITATHMLTAAVETNAQLAKLPGFLIGDVEAVAAEGYRACMQGAVICVPGKLNAAATIAGRAAPKWLVRRVAGAIGRAGI